MAYTVKKNAANLQYLLDSTILLHYITGLYCNIIKQYYDINNLANRAVHWFPVKHYSGISNAGYVMWDSGISNVGYLMGVRMAKILFGTTSENFMDYFCVLSQLVKILGKHKASLMYSVC